MTDNQFHYEETTAVPVEDSEIDLEKARRGTRLLLEAIGEEPNEAPLTETFERRGPEILATLTEGTRETAKPDLRTFEADADELVVKTEIPIYSLCEHHLLPFFGVAHIDYRPGEEIVGLSKLPATCAGIHAGKYDFDRRRGARSHSQGSCGDVQAVHGVL
ncbi:GTP cyclohydrolase I [Salinarchaeum sp. Harcht-Bsk1]|nr:GTP cyclohydrolase I [Salinarchaeum sp. Harcht-Bsk1]